MATSGRGTGTVGYNVQNAVDSKHHLIVAHEVTNMGHDRCQQAHMARQAQEARGIKALKVVADRGYFKGEEILTCHKEGVTSKPLTSPNQAKGLFPRAAFRYQPECNEYSCPAGQRLTWRSYRYCIRGASPSMSMFSHMFHPRRQETQDMVRKTRSDSTVGSFEKSRGLPPGTVRNPDGRDTRSDKKIGTIREEHEKKNKK